MNHVTIKVLAVRYPSAVDRVKDTLDHLRKVVDVHPDQLKQNIRDLLFGEDALFNYNYLLYKVNDELFHVEPIDIQRRLIARKKINYHPCMYLF